MRSLITLLISVLKPKPQNTKVVFNGHEMEPIDIFNEMFGGEPGKAPFQYINKQ